VDARIDVHADDTERVVVAVWGEVDLASRDRLQSAIVTAIGEAGPGHNVIVDLSETTFLDSTGIGVLVRGSQAADAAITVGTLAIDKPTGNFVLGVMVPGAPLMNKIVAGKCQKAQ